MLCSGYLAHHGLASEINPEALAGEAVREEAEAGGATLALEVGALARLADGSCVASMGDTVVLATAVCRPQSARSRRDQDTLQVRSMCGRIPSRSCVGIRCRCGTRGCGVALWIVGRPLCWILCLISELYWFVKHGEDYRLLMVMTWVIALVTAWPSAWVILLFW